MTRNTLFALALAAAGVTFSAPAWAETKSAYFAGGCFWCIEKDFESVKGVKEVVSGYQGGELENPTYRNHEGHREVVKIDYDPAAIDYSELLKIFFRSVNPTDAGGQFCDRGFAYSTGIYAETDEEKSLALEAKAEAADILGKEIATEVADFKPFTTAEDYHQNYYLKNPVRYKFYRSRCGRNQTVEALWGDEAYYRVGEVHRGS
jgi:peptide-methionine (S)-S-oxide reductase